VLRCKLLNTRDFRERSLSGKLYNSYRDTKDFSDSVGYQGVGKHEQPIKFRSLEADQNDTTRAGITPQRVAGKLLGLA